MSADTEQAMKGSLSERHKERKEETWVSGTGFLLLASYFECQFFVNDDDDEACLWLYMYARLSHCVSLARFRTK